jgi:hypothetical protein
MRIPNKVLIAVAAIGLVAGTSGIALTAVKAVAKPTPRKVRVYKPGKAVMALSKLKISIPVIDVPTTPLPTLSLSAMNVGSPSSGVADSFNNFRADKNLIPKVDAPTIPSMPAMTAPTMPVAPAAPSAPSAPTGGAPTPSAATCAQFASMPNAGLCTMVGDAGGQALCQACKSSGF